MVSGSRTLQAADAFHELCANPRRRIQPGFLEFRGRVFLGPLAVSTDHADQPLRHDAVERRYEIVRLDAHVDEASDHVGDVVGVHGGEHQVAGKRGLNGDLRGLLVANFADHDLVRVVPQNRTQSAREGQSLFLVHRNLRDAAKLIFDGVFDGDDLVFVALDLVDGGVERGGLARAGRPRNQHHAVWFADVAAKFAHLLAGKTNDIQAEALEFFGERLFVQDAQHRVFSVARGHDGDAQIDEAALVFNPEAAVLRHAALGDIQVAEHLDTGNHRGVPFLGDRLHGVLQDAVDAVLDGDLRVACFDVNVAGSPLEGGEDNGFHQANDRADRGVAGEAIAGNGLVALFFVFTNLQSERFGSLFQHALRLLGALEQVADLARRGNLDCQFLAQEKRELNAEQYLTGVGHGNRQEIVL